MKQRPIGTILRDYETGRITRSEMEFRLVQAAAFAAPEELAPLLPAHEIETLQTLAASLPRSFEESPRIFALEMTESQAREERKLWYDGIRRWHEFFETRATELA